TTGATITNRGKLNIEEGARYWFSSGTVTGAGTLTIEKGATADISGPGLGDPVFDGGGNLNNAGLIELKGTVTMNGSFLTNIGVIDDSFDGDIKQVKPVNNKNSKITNAGLFKKTGKGGTTDVQIEFADTGKVVEKSGTLKFRKEDKITIGRIRNDPST